MKWAVRLVRRSLLENYHGPPSESIHGVNVPSSPLSTSDRLLTVILIHRPNPSLNYRKGRYSKLISPPKWTSDLSLKWPFIWTKNYRNQKWPFIVFAWDFCFWWADGYEGGFIFLANVVNTLRAVNYKSKGQIFRIFKNEINFEIKYALKCC